MNHRQHDALAPHLWMHQVGNEHRNGHSSHHEISNGQVDQEVVGVFSTWLCFHKRSNGHIVLAIIIRMATTPYDVPQNAAWTLERVIGTRLWGTEELFMIILRYNKKTKKSSMTCKHHHFMVWC